MRTLASRRRASVALVVATALLLAVTAICGYARAELVDSRAFGDRAASSLDDPDVRRVVGEQVVDGLSGSVAPDLLVLRPLVVTGVSALAATPPFRRVLRAAVLDRHEQLFTGENRFVLELPVHGRVILQALRSLSPRVARAVPPGYELPLLGLRPRSFELTVARLLGTFAGWWWPLLAVSALAAAACAAVAGSVRQALVQLGIAVAGAGLLVAATVAVLGAVIVAHAAQAGGLDEDHGRRAIAALWDALAGDLRTAGLLAALGGVAVAVLGAGGLALERLAAAAAWLRRGARSPRPAARRARAAALLATGAALLLVPSLTLRVAAVAAGALAVIAGAAQLAAGRPRERATSPGRPAASPVVLGAAVVLAVGLTVAAVALVLPAPSGISALAAPKEGCNGSRALCDRRLDEVVFPATHNSYAAAAEPGWLFANQRHGIARQLRDGIRGFLIDVHPGVFDPRRGRVRTDLQAEGSSRNKVAAQLSPEALRTADRLAGRVGAGSLDGPRRVYLCHTLCELGAEPFAQQLGLLRRHLEANADDVLVVFVEPYVPVQAIERGFEEAGLLRYTAELRRDEPLPTLGELVASGRRLIVMAEQDGGARPWYLDGFAFFQDTDYRVVTGPDKLGCARFRGSPDSPLLLVNHWIATFPPAPTANRRIGGSVLDRRLRRCEAERGLVPNLVAVDFYERSDVVRIAARLNARGPR